MSAGKKKIVIEFTEYEFKDIKFCVSAYLSRCGEDLAKRRTPINEINRNTAVIAWNAIKNIKV